MNRTIHADVCAQYGTRTRTDFLLETRAVLQSLCTTHSPVVFGDGTYIFGYITAL